MKPCAPPTLESLRANTQLRVGPAASTIIADFDFETYSPAGFEWNDTTQKWQAPHGTDKKGISIVGAARYTEHPDAAVLSLAYDLKDGLGVRHWYPGASTVALDDLFSHIQSGKLIEAWNVSFEYWVWVNICVPKYGFPPLNPKQLRCAMAKARAFALPGALVNAGSVLKTNIQKDKTGTRLLDRYSKPRNPTKHDPRSRIFPELSGVEREDTQALYDYNIRDIQAEAEISSRIPDLSDFELEFWQCDQAINRRGVYIDLASIKSCMAIIEQAHAKYNAELFALTNGAVSSASKMAQLLKWVKEQGSYHALSSLDAENIEALLAQPQPPQVRRALEIRQLIGSAAVKKLYSMANQVCNDGRLHDLFIYYSAHTGRAAGAGPQPQNLPNSGPRVAVCCNCNKHSVWNLQGLRSNPMCNWCGSYNWRGSIMEVYPSVEWNIEAVEDALSTINTQSLACVELFFGDAIAAVSGCLRGLFIAAPGHDLICSDYSAIEAVVLAELSGETWRQDVFRTHGKIYEMSAAKIKNIPFEEFERHKKETGQHHHLRKMGKTAELACFEENTLVLTDKGYVRIIDIAPGHRLWDGVEWVTHDGVISKGVRGVVPLDGVYLTREHPVAYSEGCWVGAEILGKYEYHNTLLQALAFADNLPPEEEIIPTEDIDVAVMLMMLRAESVCGQYGLRLGSDSQVEVYDIVNAGPRNRFTIKTSSGHLIVHNSGYGGWINAWKRFGADEFLTDDEIKTAILNWRKASPAVVEFWGGQKRNWNPELYGIEGHAIQAILNPCKEYVFRKLKFQVIDNILYVTLLSGRKLIYHNPRVIPHFEQRRGLQILFEGWNSNPTMGPLGWVKKDTYSGKLTENIAQATARDILAFAIVNLEAKGYPVVLHIHDEIGSEVPEGFGSIEGFEAIMSTMPEWAAGWPVKAHGGWRGKRYRK